MTHRLALLGFLFSAASGISAQGIVIPEEPELPPLALERHAVRVEIENQAAVTTVEQIFANHTERRLEVQYLFPVPKGAALTRFTMLVNGKETAAEMVDRDRAKQVYQSIVRRSMDPGLIEYLGGEIFRANIFPVEPRSKQTITVRFTQALAAEGGLVSYLYPVRAGAKRGPTVLGEASLEIVVRSAVPIHNVYSPSHPVVVEKKNDREARVTWSQKNAVWNRDFQLFYGYGDQEVGLNLVAYRPDPSEPGYFMILLSPKCRQAERVVERDIVFVLDTSGSMAGEKMEQARNALKHCILNLNDGDRFDLVRFSTEAEAWKGELVLAKEMREAALFRIDKFQAAGGTDIFGALKEALKYPREPHRPFVVVFMTDGKPTLGESTDPRQILAHAKERGEGARVFTWGVGYDVDTQLLDGIAEACRGVSQYVRPEEDIAVKVSSFWGKASKPVLADLELTVDGDKVRLSQFHPSPLGDLYAGGQLVLIGRYTGEGAVALHLSGSVNGERETFTYEGTFPATEAKTAFLEPLWARRRIGHLLDAIRLHGESKELVDEVVTLAKKYGVQTPYTSWLIVEDGSATARGAELEKKLGDLAPGGGGKDDEEARREYNAARKSETEGFHLKEGKSAVDAAKYLRSLKETERDGDRMVPVRRAAGTRFVLYRSMWVDDRFEADMGVTVVKFGSEVWFRLLEKRPELAEILKLGTDVAFKTAKGKALVVAAKGKEKLTDGEIENLFSAP